MISHTCPICGRGATLDRYVEGADDGLRHIDVWLNTPCGHGRAAAEPPCTGTLKPLRLPDAAKRAELAERRIALCLALMAEFPATFGSVAVRIRKMLTADI